MKLHDASILILIENYSQVVESRRTTSARNGRSHLPFPDYEQPDAPARALIRTRETRGGRSREGGSGNRTQFPHIDARVYATVRLHPQHTHSVFFEKRFLQ
jgi:hypothetical protein